MRFVFGECTLDTERYELRRAGQVIALEPMAFRVLTYLLRHAGRAVAKHDLLQAFWPDTSEAHYTEYSLRNCLAKIRQAVRDARTQQPVIETVRGYGYRFAAAVAVFPLDTSTAPLPPAVTPVQRLHNLPVPLTTLIGREPETAAGCQLLRRVEVRLLTLTGPGGIGKTRVGRQVAADLLEDFAHGVSFVPLATLSDASLVPSTITQILGVQETNDQEPLDGLKAYLRDKQLLLVLDNFEQVISAASAVAELLTACPMLKLLVTSREVLRLGGEYEFPIPPLALPDPRYLPPPAMLAQYAAVALFLERALAAKPDFALTSENAAAVAEICVRLDGLPLALELAAARIKLLSPHAMLARLESRLEWLRGGRRDMPPRHQALRNAIAWSYDLLNPYEQGLFRQLAVFVGGCTLEAAAVVCKAVDDPAIEGGAPLAGDVFNGMASLVDKSLLQPEEAGQGEPRFRMLESIREYGLECLAVSQEAQAVQDAHADYYRALAETAEPQLAGPEQAVWLERLEAEHDNIRVALRWVEARGDVEAGLRLAGALWQFWLARSYLHEGRERLARILQLAQMSTHTVARAKVLAGAGHLAHNQGDYAAARTLFETSLALWREVGDKRGMATALNDLGWVAWRQGDYTAARALSEESLVCWQALGETQGIATSLTNLGWIAHCQGNYAAACALHKESLALRQALEDKRGVAFSLALLGWALSRQGIYGRAVSLLEEAIAQFQEVGMKQLFAFSSSLLAEVIDAQGDNRRAAALVENSVTRFREIGDKYGLAVALGIHGTVVSVQGDLRHATALYEQSLTLRTALGDKWGMASALCRLATVVYAQGDTNRATVLYEQSLALRTALGDQHGMAECYEGLAEVAVAQQHLQRAARLCGAAEILRTTTGAALVPHECARVERIVAAARTGLGDAGLMAAWTTGTASPKHASTPYGVDRLTHD